MIERMSGLDMFFPGFLGIKKGSALFTGNSTVKSLRVRPQGFVVLVQMPPFMSPHFVLVVKASSTMTAHEWWR